MTPFIAHGSHATAQLTGIPRRTPAEHVARLLADFDVNVLGALSEGSQERWDGEQVAECLLEYQKRLEAV